MKRPSTSQKEPTTKPEYDPNEMDYNQLDEMKEMGN
jgi:hypothetical protein